MYIDRLTDISINRASPISAAVKIGDISILTLLPYTYKYITSLIAYKSIEDITLPKLTRTSGNIYLHYPKFTLSKFTRASHKTAV